MSYFKNLKQIKTSFKTQEKDFQSGNAFLNYTKNMKKFDAKFMHGIYLNFGII